MNKYYVTWGSRQCIVMAGNEVAACIATMNKVFEKYVDVIGRQFHVSQRGFDLHDDDYEISLDEVIRIKILANEYEDVSETSDE